jgi:hypothetical protein
MKYAQLTRMSEGTDARRTQFAKDLLASEIPNHNAWGSILVGEMPNSWATTNENKKLVKDFKVVKPSFFKTDTHGVYAVIISAFRDQFMIAMSKTPTSMPRGFPIFWDTRTNRTQIVMHGFLPKFKNDDRGQESFKDTSDFKDVTEAYVLEKFSGFLGQVFVYDDLIYVFSKNSSNNDFSNSFIKILRATKFHENTELLKFMQETGATMCAEVFDPSFDKCHGYIANKEGYIVTSISYPGKSDKTLEYETDEKVAELCIKHNLPVGHRWKVVGIDNIHHLFEELEKHRDFMSASKFLKIIGAAKNTTFIKGSVDHIDLVGERLEGLIVKTNIRTFKYKFPAYTVVTMWLRGLICFCMVSKTIQKSIERFLNHWCVSDAGRVHWRKIMYAIALHSSDVFMVDGTLLEKDDVVNMGGHSKLVDKYWLSNCDKDADAYLQAIAALPNLSENILIAAMSPAPGAGKTTTMSILSEITGINRRSQDMEKGKNQRPAYLRSLTNAFKSNNVVIADKTNAMTGNRDDYGTLKGKNKKPLDLSVVWVQFILAGKDTFDETALRKVCLDRINSRGFGHEGTLYGTNPDLKPIVDGFFDRYQPLSDMEKATAAAVIDIDVTDSPVVQVIQILKVLKDLKIYTKDHSIEDIQSAHTKVIAIEKKTREQKEKKIRTLYWALELDEQSISTIKGADNISAFHALHPDIQMQDKYHITLAYNPSKVVDGSFMKLEGTSIALDVDKIATDGKAMAIPVVLSNDIGHMSTATHPHITLGTTKQTKPAHSGRMLKDAEDSVEDLIQSMTTMKLTGTIVRHTTM